MRHFFFSIILLITALLGCSQPNNNSDCAYKGGNLDYLSVLKCEKDFEALQSLPLSRKFGNVHAIKVIYDIQTKRLYYVSGKRYEFHWDFCQTFLRAYGEDELNRFCQVEYSASSRRRFILGNLNHYLAPNIYTLEFFSDDKVNETLISVLYQAVQKSAYFGNELKVLNNSAELAKKLPKLNLPSLTIDSLYSAQAYQPLNKTFSYGYLRKVAVKDFDKFHFQPHDIILTDGLPNDFPLVQGIITAQFQTPLCHINLLSNNRGTPNAALKTAWTDPKFDKFVDKLVYYQVSDDSILLSLTTETKAQAYWLKYKPTKHLKIALDTSYKALIGMKELDWKMAKAVGTKAANFGELSKAFAASGANINVPEGGFAIPFYFYCQHIRQHHLQPQIDEIIAYANGNYERRTLIEKLEQLQDAIEAASLDERLLKAVEERVKSSAYKAFRFRSSTNAEDIAGFNGAGLYTSKTGILNDEKKSIARAIKKVWASAWNVRAFEERAHFGIPQEKVAMGILCHRNFGEEAANGVAITKHLYRKNYPAFTINTQVGETSVVLPTDSVTCEQFVMNFSVFVTGRSELGIEYVSASSLLPKNERVLSEKELYQLADVLKGIKNHFFYKTNYGTRGIDASAYENYALDIEFKLERNTRKLYVKQVRMLGD